MDPMREKRSLHLYIEGIVQGVGFRYFTEHTARRLGLSGYVRNLPDGRVETYAEGNAASLQEFLIKMHEGPRYGRVDKVDEKWGEPTGRYDSFQVY